MVRSHARCAQEANIRTVTHTKDPVKCVPAAQREDGERIARKLRARVDCARRENIRTATVMMLACHAKHALAGSSAATVPRHLGAPANNVLLGNTSRAQACRAVMPVPIVPMVNFTMGATILVEVSSALLARVVATKTQTRTRLAVRSAVVAEKASITAAVVM